jgi:VWFA-related protein
MRARWSLLFLTLAAAGMLDDGYLAAQQRPAEPFRSAREVLTIDASVLDASGRPIMDLQAADFIVKIDGAPRQVLIAHRFGTDAGRIVNADAAPTPRFTRSLDVQPGRLVMFAIDRDSIRLGNERAMLETAAKMVDALSSSDAIGVAGVPTGGIDLTRDRKAAAEAIKKLTGTQPLSSWQHQMSWDEAIEMERDAQSRRSTAPDAIGGVTQAKVIQRECPKEQPLPGVPNECVIEINTQVRDMVNLGRAHASNVLKGIDNIIDRLGALHAPKHLVLISGGIPFDLDTFTRYKELADKAARAHVAMFVVQLDQGTDASDRGNFGTVFGGREYTQGLGTIASSTGGVLFEGVGKAGGVFDRIATEVNYFYELGVESSASDANGKSHRIDITVNRPGAHVRAPAETIVSARPSGAAGEAIVHALSEPTDVAELPFEVAAYMTHSKDLDKVRVMVSATVADGPAPAEWGYVIMDGSKVVASSRSQADPNAPAPWAASASVDVDRGRYRLRTAVIGADGRIGVLETPLLVGMRMAGTIETSDVMLGTTAGGLLVPRASLKQADQGIAMIELSSAEPLSDATATLQLTRGGTADAAQTRPLILHTRDDDKSIVVGEARIDSAALTPGIYTASVILTRGGSPIARVSRVIEVTPGAPAASAPPASGARAASARNPELDGALQRVGNYVATFGQQASLIVGVEHYEQHYQNSPVGEPSYRQMNAEFALVKTTSGWAGYRDVSNVDQKPIPDRQSRLRTLLTASAPDMSEARRIADESARFNIGPMKRNFNEPTAVLFFMSAASQPRFSFTPKGTATVGGVDVARIDYQEEARPTYIRTSDGKDAPCRGTLWINPADGTVVRTKLLLTGYGGQGSSAEIEVTFAKDQRLDLWLPVTMVERYVGKLSREGTAGRSRVRAGMSVNVVTGESVVTATATYSDFKRFETGGAVK